MPHNRDVPEIRLIEVPCPRCGERRSRPVAHGRDHLYGIPGEFTAAECLACGLWFQNPRPADDDLGRLYPSEYTPHEAPPPSRSLLRQLRRPLGNLYRRLKRGELLIPRSRPGGRLLEVGCASGSRLLSLREQGWRELTGIEFVPSAADRARAAGFDVLCGDAAEELAKLPDASFDVIIASMVFEHLVSPFAVIDLITKKLKPGGEFLFSTVVRDSWDAEHFGSYWAGFDFPRHMVFFSLADIRRALRDSYEHLETFFQNAPVDYVRSASWRRDASDERMLKMPNVFRTIFGAWLASRGKTTRVSFRCVKSRQTP